MPASSSQIKALLFDSEGVLRLRPADVPRGQSRRNAIYAAIEREYGVSRKALRAELARLGIHYEHAEQLADLVQAPLSHLAGRAVDPRVWQPLLGGGFIEENIEAVRGLRPAYQTGVIANTRRVSLRFLLEHHQISDLFDVQLDSAEVGIEKPDLAIYRLAADRLGRRPAECLFVDDKVENVAGAESAGMLGLQYSVEDGTSLGDFLAANGFRPAS